jgi:phosphoribosyl-dephospho-CoA transferase
MKMDVHDLIKLNSMDEKMFDMSLPVWALESLKAAPYVVVRRGKSKQIQGNNYLPIGIRGGSREERFGCLMLKQNYEKVITPKQIVEEKMWMNSSNSSWKVLLEQLEKRFQKWKDKLAWGPTGSVGFELVTKQKVTRKQSDIDLIINPKLHLSVEEARQLLNELQEKSTIVNHTIVDISMQTEKGWIALSEYAGGLGTYLIKTETGEQLVQDIW